MFDPSNLVDQRTNSLIPMPVALTLDTVAPSQVAKDQALDIVAPVTDSPEEALESIKTAKKEINWKLRLPQILSVIAAIALGVVTALTIIGLLVTPIGLGVGVGLFIGVAVALAAVKKEGGTREFLLTLSACGMGFAYGILGVVVGGAAAGGAVAATVGSWVVLSPMLGGMCLSTGSALGYMYDVNKNRLKLEPKPAHADPVNKKLVKEMVDLVKKHKDAKFKVSMEKFEEMKAASQMAFFTQIIKKGLLKTALDMIPESVTALHLSAGSIDPMGRTLNEKWYSETHHENALVILDKIKERKFKELKTLELDFRGLGFITPRVVLNLSLKSKSDNALMHHHHVEMGKDCSYTVCPPVKTSMLAKIKEIVKLHPTMNYQLFFTGVTHGNMGKSESSSEVVFKKDKFKQTAEELKAHESIKAFIEA